MYFIPFGRNSGLFIRSKQPAKPLIVFFLVDIHILVKLFSGGALAILLCNELSVRLGGDKVTMYNFGAPRTGNSAFAEAYSTVNQDSYRIVNAWDPIARFPRGRNASFLNYEHVGKTVLLNSKDPGDTWVSGSHYPY
jgi:predicted lipase